MTKNKANKKKMNPILWIIFAIIIPLMITTVIAIVVLSFAGIDVIDWAKKKGSTVPVVSSFIKTDEEKDLNLKLERSEEKIEKQQEEIEELKLEIESLNSLREQQEQQILKLENKAKSEQELSQSDGTQPDGTQQPSNNLKQTAASFRKMNGQKAADIIQNLNRDDAIEILQQLSNDVRGKILEEMEPKVAAELTGRLMNQ